MTKFCAVFGIAAMMSSSALAKTTSCRTNDPSCQGYTTFGPAGVARCISIRGQTRTDFCQQVGDARRVRIHAGDQYCGVSGNDPVPDQCDLHWITVTEPQRREFQGETDR